MIDDGKYDPPEYKLEDTEFALASQAIWEVEFVQADIADAIKKLEKPDDTKPSLFWRLIEAIGRTFIDGWIL